MNEVLKKYYNYSKNLYARLKVLLDDGAYTTVYSDSNHCGNKYVEFVNAVNTKSLGVPIRVWNNRRCIKYLTDLANGLVEEPRMTVVGWYGSDNDEVCVYEVLSGYNHMYSIMQYYSGHLSLSEGQYELISKSLMNKSYYLEARMSDGFEQPTIDELKFMYNYYVGNKE